MVGGTGAELMLHFTWQERLCNFVGFMSRLMCVCSLTLSLLVLILIKVEVDISSYNIKLWCINFET